MTRMDLRRLMGPPTDEFGPDTGSPQMSWDAYAYQFNAFFDIDDSVKQLDINTIGLTPSERSAITCAETRTADSP